MATHPRLPSRRYIMRLPLVSPRQWLRRIVFWVGALLVACMAILFAKCADGAAGLFELVVSRHPWLALVICPAGFALSALLARRVFPGSQGSGIPQVIAAQHMTDRGLIAQTLSIRIGIGKVILTLLGLACGASIGREGPTVQVGSTIMYQLGRLMALPRLDMERALILAGGAAGIAGAFNTPIAGVVFAIEELAHAFETRTAGRVLTAVIIAGVTTLGLVGNYTYFGTTSVVMDFGRDWVAVLLCGVVGGLSGGLFSALLIRFADGLPGAAGRWIIANPIAFAAMCGLTVAALGLASGGMTYGTGYAQAAALVEETAPPDHAFVVMKFIATVVSYISGIPGGLFAPSLAVGAGVGAWIAPVVPSAPVGAVILLGMVAYFSGVVQAPITAAVIVMEMTDDQHLTVALLATSYLAFGCSRLVCRRPIYGALGMRFLASTERAAHSRRE